MKRTPLTILALLLCAGGFAQSKKDAEMVMEEAISYAKSIAYVYTNWNLESLKKNFKAARSLETTAFAFVSYRGNEGGRRGLDMSIEQNDPGPRWLGGGVKQVWFSVCNKVLPAYHGTESSNEYVVFPGVYQLRIPKDGSTIEHTKTGIEYLLDSLDFNFEKGKYYTIHSFINEDDKVEFSLKETDTESYLAFQKENPEYLTGTWSEEKKKNLRSLSNALNKTFTQYTIQGNRMVFEAKAGKKSFTAEGSILFNENTLILLPEKAIANGREMEKFNEQPPYIWYYTLSNGVLTLREPIHAGL